MMESLLKDLKKYLECSICLETYNEPKTISFYTHFATQPLLCNVEKTLSSNTSLHFTIFQHWKSGMGVLTLQVLRLWFQVSAHFLTQFVQIQTLHSTHGFHDSNMFLPDQCRLLLIGQILVAIDSLDLVLKLLLPARYVMVSLHKGAMPQLLPQESDSA